MILIMTIHTANILGTFTDPFEFEGDYGPEVNPVRQKVFELVIAKEAFAKNLTAIKADKEHGPTLSELVPPELIEELKKKINQSDFDPIVHFIEKYGSEKVFYFFRNCPREFLSLDRMMSHQLPILSSTKQLLGENALQLKMNLLDALMTQETIGAAKQEAFLRNAIQKLDLKKFLGENADSADLEAFCTPAGQTFFYFAYQALNLHLVSEKPGLIAQINKVKEIFQRTLGDPEARARQFKEKLVAADSGVLFTQECDSAVPRALDELFLPIGEQNKNDGCFVFLRSDLWKPDYELIPIDGYEGYREGRMSVVLGTRKDSGEKFLLSSCHGKSTNAADGREQIALVMEKYKQLSEKISGLQLLIGIDANTKNEEEVQALKEHLDQLGLVGTDVGPTTIKQRMVTTQHAKAGREACDQEDYLITLKSELGGRYLLSHPTVGFKEERPDPNIPLPNIENQSDHYPIGVSLAPLL